MNITNKGILNTNMFTEYHIEPDGTIWEHIFHHERLDINNFSSSDPFASGQVYKSP